MSLPITYSEYFLKDKDQRTTSGAYTGMVGNILGDTINYITNSSINDIWVKEASLGTDFYWNLGLLEVSGGTGGTQGI